jgi:anti-sigma factor RsiW
MKCQECQQEFEAMLSSGIESSARSAAEAHLRECAQCSQAFTEARQLWALLDQAPSHQPSHGFADRVLRQLDTEPGPASRWWTAWSASLRWTVASAAVVVVVAITCLAVYKHGHEKRQLAHFEELFNLAQNVDPETVVNAAAFENGDAL